MKRSAERSSGHSAAAPGAAALSPDDRSALRFMELLQPDGAEVLASYDHPAWGGQAAVTRHRSGAGTAIHLGTMTGPALVREVLALAVRDAGLWDWPQELGGTVTVRRGVSSAGAPLTYLLNYSGSAVQVTSPVTARSVLDDATVAEGADLTVGAWDLTILEEVH